jgi:hypothetical protein
MQRFAEFLELARRWPRDNGLRVASCRREYEVALALGCTEEQIIAGTRHWLENCVPRDTSDFMPIAPHTFLAEQSFLAYQPEERSLRVVK